MRVPPVFSLCLLLLCNNSTRRSRAPLVPPGAAPARGRRCCVRARSLPPRRHAAAAAGAAAHSAAAPLAPGAPGAPGDQSRRSAPVFAVQQGGLVFDDFVFRFGVDVRPFDHGRRLELRGGGGGGGCGWGGARLPRAASPLSPPVPPSLARLVLVGDDANDGPVLATAGGVEKVDLEEGRRGEGVDAAARDAPALSPPARRPLPPSSRQPAQPLPCPRRSPRRPRQTACRPGPAFLGRASWRANAGASSPWRRRWRSWTRRPGRES